MRYASSRHLPILNWSPLSVSSGLSTSSELRFHLISLTGIKLVDSVGVEPTMAITLRIKSPLVSASYLRIHYTFLTLRVESIKTRQLVVATGIEPIRAFKPRALQARPEPYGSKPPLARWKGVEPLCPTGGSFGDFCITINASNVSLNWLSG